MSYKEWENLGNKVEDIIEHAVKSKDFQHLNKTITQAVNNTIRQYKENMPAQKMREEMQMKKEQNRLPAELYASVRGERVKGVLKILGGGFVISGMTLTMLIGLFAVMLGDGGMTAMGMMALGEAAGIGLLTSGCKDIGRLGRFKKYIKAIGTRTYCNFDVLAKAVGKSSTFVKKDINKMMKKGWFIEGHVDTQETCLITTHDTYQQYQVTQNQLAVRQEEERKQAQKAQSMAPEVRDVLQKGNEYIEKIRKCNDEIPGEEISNKIYKIEEIVRQIFKRAEEHPEVISDLKRLMEYYLPMTVKLLEAYVDMDRQPVQGETIRSSKKEIEDTLDTLNDAFEKLLDSIFQDTAWDLSSDISVLHTVLAQEGLKKTDFNL